MKASELEAALKTIQDGLALLPDQLTKAQTEITNEIDNLKNNNPDLPQPVVDSLAAIQASAGKIATVAQALDDLNPDAPTTPPTP